MTTISKADAQVIKECTVLSAYCISGAIDAIPDVTAILMDDLRELNSLDESELVTASKRLVTLAIRYSQTPSQPLQDEAKQALSELGDLLMRTKEIK